MRSTSWATLTTCPAGSLNIAGSSSSVIGFPLRTPAYHPPPSKAGWSARDCPTHPAASRRPAAARECPRSVTPGLHRSPRRSLLHARLRPMLGRHQLRGILERLGNRATGEPGMDALGASPPVTDDEPAIA